MTFASFLIGQAERGRIPDGAIRAGVRAVVASRVRHERNASSEERDRFWAEAWDGPIALVPDLANQQHYEIPAGFFDIVLGPHLKYSCSLWAEHVSGLPEAEQRMLELYAERAELDDGQSILDLGCGWGSFSLWAADEFPNGHVTAVSNSKVQRLHIEEQAYNRGIENLEVITADINEFDPYRVFDRVVSIEMMEHVRNHRALFKRISRWIAPEGAMFVHVFAHREYAYPYEIGGAADWMARTFFSGGVMPTQTLLSEAADPFFSVESGWWLDGTHYEMTCNAWLQRLDAHADHIRAILEPVYGDDVDIWIRRWRIFFMSCAELFGYHDGQEWGIVHNLFRPRSVA